jgi:crotonobetainyl-CoA:carnitine CoA-transferase CaiB-like acyl-CoA transferase
VPEVELKVVGLPVSFDGERPPVKSRAPNLGEHTADIRGSDTAGAGAALKGGADART